MFLVVSVQWPQPQFGLFSKIPNCNAMHCYLFLPRKGETELSVLYKFLYMVWYDMEWEKTRDRTNAIELCASFQMIRVGVGKEVNFQVSFQRGFGSVWQSEDFSTILNEKLF